MSPATKQESPWRMKIDPRGMLTAIGGRMTPEGHVELDTVGRPVEQLDAILSQCREASESATEAALVMGKDGVR